MDNQLEQLEKELQACRRQMSALTGQVNRIEDELHRIRRENAQAVHSMDKEQSEELFLRQKAETAIPETEYARTEVAAMPEKEYARTEETAVPETEYVRTEETAPPETDCAQSNFAQPQKAKEPLRERAAANAESVIGKKVMGIVASTLIFISLIMFATLFIPKLGDTAKFLLMCVVSASFTVFGLYKLSKDDKSPLYLSITGCGVGAIYISLFLSNVYFHVTGDAGLYLLLLIWAMGVLYLSKQRSRIFQVIGNLGILISVIFGTVLCVMDDDAGKMIILIGYFIIGSLAFYLCHMRSTAASAVNHAFQVGSLLSLMIGEAAMSDELLRYAGMIVLAVFLLAMLALVFWDMDRDNVTAPGIFGICYSAEILLLEMLAVENDHVSAEVGLLIAAVILVCVEIKVYRLKRTIENHAVIVIWTVLLALADALMMVSVPALVKTVGFALLAIPFACYGFAKNREVYKVMGLVTGYLFLFQESVPLGLQATFLLMLLGVTGWGLYKGAGQYKAGYKVAWYVLGILGICLLADRMYYDLQNAAAGEYMKMTAFLLIAAANVCMAKTRLGRNWKTGEEERASYVVSCIVNALLMFYSSNKIGSVSSEVLHVIYILAALALFTVNVRNLIAKKKVYLDLYVAGKYTILLLVILTSFQAANYLVSILLFVLAIVSIFAGFRFRIKTLRIYGLVLSLLCVVKLVMMDITYDNTLGHALSFFISGVLCFVISAIYYSAERKMREI
ncbi:MAG: DUF2339 domain-containing protein [Lachnospiraceae bacterium]|nr:DUF2339 domain-containing protein [Lachnospiraceae bacterium]